MTWRAGRRAFAIAACALACACGPVSVASYPGQTSFPPAEIQPLDLKLGVIPYSNDARTPRQEEVPTEMRSLRLFKSVEASDPADPNPAARFDLLLDLRGMGLTSERVAALVAAGTSKMLYSWKPDCGWTDSWCVNPEKLARDVAWLLAAGTPLRAKLAEEMKKADAERKQAAAAPDDGTAPAPANTEKPWWASGSK